MKKVKKILLKESKFKNVASGILVIPGVLTGFFTTQFFSETPKIPSAACLVFALIGLLWGAWSIWYSAHKIKHTDY